MKLWRSLKKLGYKIISKALNNPFIHPSLCPSDVYTRLFINVPREVQFGDNFQHKSAFGIRHIGTMKEK